MIVSADASYKVFKKDEGGGLWSLVYYNDDSLLGWYAIEGDVDPDTWVDAGSSGTGGILYSVVDTSETQDAQNVPDSSDSKVAYTVASLVSFLEFDSGALKVSALDEDDLASDSDTNLATQQSIKAYADSVSLSQSDQTFTGSESRVVTGEGDSDLYFRFFDTNASTFTEEGSWLISPTEMNFAYHDGDGAGAQTDTLAYTISSISGLEVTDSKFNQGITYVNVDKANFTAQSVVNKDYVDTFAMPVLGATLAADFTVTGADTYDWTIGGSGSVNTDRMDNVGVHSSSLMSFDCGEQGTDRFFVAMLYSLDLFQLGHFDDANNEYTGFSISSGGVTAVDQEGLKGMVYEADYSANYTDRSIVDKGYVDTAIGAVATIYDADGTITGPTNRNVIGEANADLSFIIHDTNNATYENRTEIILSPERLQLRYDEGDGTGASNGFVELDFDGGGIVFTNTVTSAGILYSADYSSNYTDRSLVDKGYVDGEVSGLTFQDLYSGTDSPDITISDTTNGAFSVKNAATNVNTDSIVEVLDDDDSVLLSVTPSALTTNTAFKSQSSQSDSTVTAILGAREYFISAGSGGGQYYIGDVRDDGGTDGGIDFHVHFAYDYGTSGGHFSLHGQVAVRGANFDAYWYTTGDNATDTVDRVYIRCIDIGSDTYQIWLVAEDFAICRMEATIRQGGNWVDSGTLTSGTLPTGTDLADTRDEPTSTIHAGYIVAANPVLQTSNGTDTSTNLNTPAATATPIFTATDLEDDPYGDFTVNSTTQAQVNFDGRVELSANVTAIIANATGRVSLFGRFQVDGTYVGPQSRSYMRGTEETNEGTNSVPSFQVDVSDGDTIEFIMQQGSSVTSTATFVQTSSSFCTIKRVK